ncbi:hypothetical protein IQ07DRAFT_640674 [Pyrenochaeta sp. DS3sAY3a]|nr:hypothetical protein IQ07DRAFT_640674 [Pyrenochaeta sp. DS3sAY3a]
MLRNIFHGRASALKNAEKFSKQQSKKPETPEEHVDALFKAYRQQLQQGARDKVFRRLFKHMEHMTAELKATRHQLEGIRTAMYTCMWRLEAEGIIKLGDFAHPPRCFTLANHEVYHLPFDIPAMCDILQEMDNAGKLASWPARNYKGLDKLASIFGRVRMYFLHQLEVEELWYKELDCFRAEMLEEVRKERV